MNEFYGQASGVADGKDIVLYHQPATPGMTTEDAEEELWQHSENIRATPRSNFFLKPPVGDSWPGVFLFQPVESAQLANPLN